jgi:hypothetical protein
MLLNSYNNANKSMSSSITFELIWRSRTSFLELCFDLEGLANNLPQLEFVWKSTFPQFGKDLADEILNKQMVFVQN